MNQNLNRDALPVGEVATKVLADAASMRRAEGDRDLAAEIGALRDRIAAPR